MPEPEQPSGKNAPDPSAPYIDVTSEPQKGYRRGYQDAPNALLNPAFVPEEDLLDVDKERLDKAKRPDLTEDSGEGQEDLLAQAKSPARRRGPVRLPEAKTEDTKSKQENEKLSEKVDLTPKED